MRYINGTKLDERVIRCDLDLGYKEGRQFGRGKSGGQVRDEHRQDYDAGRGGWGAQAQRAEMERRREEQEQRYADAQDGPGAVAGGGGDWKESAAPPEQTLKRGRSPEDENYDGSRTVCALLLLILKFYLNRPLGSTIANGRCRCRSRTNVTSNYVDYILFLHRRSRTYQRSVRRSVQDSSFNNHSIPPRKRLVVSHIQPFCQLMGNRDGLHSDIHSSP